MFFNAQRPTPNAQRPTPNAQRSNLFHAHQCDIPISMHPVTCRHYFWLYHIPKPLAEEGTRSI
jgi:hypothetical protein